MTNDKLDRNVTSLKVEVIQIYKGWEDMEQRRTAGNRKKRRKTDYRLM